MIWKYNAIKQQKYHKMWWRLSPNLGEVISKSKWRSLTKYKFSGIYNDNSFKKYLFCYHRSFHRFISFIKNKNKMQTTFRLNVNELDMSFIEKLKELFKNKEINISVEETQLPFNQYEILKKLEQVRRKHSKLSISPDVDINELIDEVNHNEI